MHVFIFFNPKLALYVAASLQPTNEPRSSKSHFSDLSQVLSAFTELKQMRKSNVIKNLRSWRTGGRWFVFVLAIFGVMVSLTLLSKFYSLRSFVVSNSFCSCNSPVTHFTIDSHVNSTLDTIIQKIQKEIDTLREMPNRELSGTKSAAFLADILGLIEFVQTSMYQTEEEHPLTRRRHQPAAADYFLTEEVRKYVRIKPNRLGKQNFMGANGTFTSIGHACFAMKRDLEEYMDYDVGEICNDDWKLAQKLMVHGCDPLPRRRCLARAPILYNKPYPINESLWRLPDDKNVRWSQYRCKNFTCLARNSSGKGFFKCADCFNLTHHEMPRWMIPQYQDSNSKLTADILITEVLKLKPGEIRIGLDFSVGTGTFAARMRDHNVTIISATINLGAPFNEMIALRGLIPLYLTINQRLPFFDNTLDLIHTTRFIDGWIDFVLLDFVLYDWDRVLRPGGLLWIDSFFCVEEDLNGYLEVFNMLNYKKHKWIVVPKLDKNGGELFFSALLEKPPRPF